MGGIQSARKVGFQELRDSIPGGFVPEQDFELFYSKCKVETARTISSVLCPSPTQLFFVVVSGEVHVQFTSPDIKNKVITAATYTAGEMIHFFGAQTECSTSSFEFNEFGHCLRYGEVKLALHFNREHKHTGRVIGIDQRAYEEFTVSANGNLHNLSAFLGINIANIVRKSPFFKAITPEQANMYGLLLKAQLSLAGKVINLRGRTPRSRRNHEALDPPDSTPSPIGCTATFMHGNGLSVPLTTNLTILCNKIKEESKVMSSSSNISRKTNQKSNNQNNTFVFRSPPQLPHGPGTPTIFDLPDINKPIPTLERENSNRGKNLVAVQEGASIGTDSYYVHKTGPVNIRAYVTTSSSVLGYIAHQSMDALFEADPRFKRVFSRNYFSVLLSWVKFSVPFIMDMDEWSVALLSCKIHLRGCDTDSIVKRKGDPSNYAYIILGGSCKEVSDSVDSGTDTDRVISWGGMLGEVALTTNTPYFHTVVAREPTLLMVLGKRVLDQIYYNNKAKLCEIRIRMMGVDVDLLHAIDHPTGSRLFHEYLTRQHAQENLTFYMACDRYDATCKSVQKMYTQILKMRARALQAEFLGNTNMPNLLQDGNESVEESVESNNHYLSQINEITSSKSKRIAGGNGGLSTKSANTTNSTSIKNIIAANTAINNTTTNTEFDSQKQFAIKVKPSNTVNSVYHSNKILIHEHDSDEELQETSVSVRRDINISNNNSMYNHNSSMHSVQNSSTNSMNYSSSAISNMYVDTSSSTIGINTSGISSGISGISSNISGGISNLSVKNMSTTTMNNSTTNLTSSSKKFNIANITTAPYTPNANIDNTTPTQSTSGAYAITPNSNHYSALQNSSSSDVHHSASMEVHNNQEGVVLTTVSTDSVINESAKQPNSSALMVDNTVNDSNSNSIVVDTSTSGIAHPENHTTNADSTTNTTAFAIDNPNTTSDPTNNTTNNTTTTTDEATDTANAESPTGRRRHHKSSFLKSKNDTYEAALQYNENMNRYMGNNNNNNGGGNMGVGGNVGVVGGMLGAVSVDGSVMNSVGGVYGGGEGTVYSAAEVLDMGLNNNKLNNAPPYTSDATHPAMGAYAAPNPTYPNNANTNNTNNTNPHSESMSDLHLRIHRQTHKLTKQITDLKAVAQHIMNTYIIEGSESQLNLPGLMRLRAEKCFNNWNNSNISGKTGKVELLVPIVRNNSFELLDGAVAEKILSGVEVGGVYHGNGSSNNSGNNSGTSDVYSGIVQGTTEHNSDNNPTTTALDTIHGVLRTQHSSINTHGTSTNTGSVNEEYQHDLALHPTHPYPIENTPSGATSHPAEPSTLDPEEAARALTQRLGLSSNNINTKTDGGHNTTDTPNTTTALPTSTTNPTTNTNTTTDTTTPFTTTSTPITNSMFMSGNAPQAINTNQPYISHALRKLNSASSGGEFSPASYQYLNRTTSVDTSAPYIPVEGIDMSFVDLFREVKQEILKLLRDDKFPRWKNTMEFQSFISSIKPYDRDREHTRTLHSSVEQNSSDKDRSVNSQSTRSKIGSV